MCSERVCRRGVVFEILTQIPHRLTFLSNICHSLLCVSLLLPPDSFFFYPLTFLWFVCSSILTLYLCSCLSYCPVCPFPSSSLLSFFCSSPYTPLPSCEFVQKGLPNPVHINQYFLPAAPGMSGMHCAPRNTLCDIINLFLARASG